MPSLYVIGIMAVDVGVVGFVIASVALSRLANNYSDVYMKKYAIRHRIKYRVISVMRSCLFLIACLGLAAVIVDPILRFGFGWTLE